MKDKIKFFGNIFKESYMKNFWEIIFNSSSGTMKYWQKRAKQYGKRSVYNMTHTLEELEAVDRFQEEIYLDVLKKYLTGNEKTALDFGCGPGRFEPMLSKLVKDKVYAVDPISTLIKFAPKIENVEYQILKNEYINLPNESIDIIFVSLVLGGITNKRKLEKVITEFKRIAKRDAIFFIVENTAKEENSNYWHYRSVDEYVELLKPLKLQLVKQYEDVGEEISIMVGKNND